MALYSRRKGCVLLGAGLASLMAARGAELGDQLQLRPAGGRTARATLVKAAAAAAQPEQPGAAVPALPAPIASAGSQGAARQLPPLPQQQQQGNAAQNGSSQRPPRRRGGPTNWRGLEPEDTGCCSLVLSPSAVHRDCKVTIPGKLQGSGRSRLTAFPHPKSPQCTGQSCLLGVTFKPPAAQHLSLAAERYAAAVFGQAPSQPSQPKLAVSAMSPDGRWAAALIIEHHRGQSPLSCYQLTCACLNVLKSSEFLPSSPSHRAHTLSVAALRGTQCELRSLASLLSSLGAAAGDRLCFEPAGALTAKATLIKAAACGDHAGPGGHAAQRQPHQGDDEDEQEEGGEKEGGGEQEAEETAQQRLGGRPPGKAAAPGQRQPAGQGSSKQPNWGGLAPCEQGPLHAGAVRTCSQCGAPRVDFRQVSKDSGSGIVHGQCLPAHLCHCTTLLCIIILLQTAMRRLSSGSLPAS